MYNKGNKREEKGGKKPFTKTTAARKTSAVDRGRKSITASSNGNSRPAKVTGKKSFSKNRSEDQFERGKSRSSSPYDKRSTSSAAGGRKPYSASTRTEGKFERSKSRSSSPYDKRPASSADRTRKPNAGSVKTGGRLDEKKTSNLSAYNNRSKSPTSRARKPAPRLGSGKEQLERIEDKNKSRTSKSSNKSTGSRHKTTRDYNIITTTETSPEKPKSRSGRGPLRTEAIFDRKKARKAEQAPQINIRLNRYIANAGICSRREADDLIGAGLVSVNGAVITEMGYQVKPGDDVRYNGERLSIEKKVYLLLNKPKDAITTFDDPEGRRTVMQLFGKELGERVYPVGRLDRNTTGVLFFTNDGDLAQRLMHPKYEMKKVYKATLDKNLKGEDIWQLTNGVELEDGFIKPDAIAIPDPKFKNEVGVEIHSGKNRIIHRIFEHLGYKVDKLDRALYAGLTKGKLKRGEWRELTEKEVNAIKRLVRLG